MQRQSSCSKTSRGGASSPRFYGVLDLIYCLTEPGKEAKKNVHRGQQLSQADCEQVACDGLYYVTKRLEEQWLS